MKPALLQVKLSLHQHPWETPKTRLSSDHNSLLPMQYVSLQIHTAVFGRAKALRMKKVELTEAEPSSSSLNFICFSQLACCYFPHYTKGSERGRGEISLLTTPRLTLHKIVHHEASPAAEQSHENSHLLQSSQGNWHFSSLKRKREDSCCKRRKPKGYFPPHPFLKALSNQA